MTDVPAFSDDARRLADGMTLHAVAKSEGWVVFRLSDGSPVNHVVYERRTDAVRDMKWDRDNFLYLEIQPDGMPIKEAQAVLDFARALNKAGFRIPSPEFEFDPTMPLLVVDRVKTINHLASGGRR